MIAGLTLILKYFPELSPTQRAQFAELDKLYRYWNTRINVISRKDILNLYERHILHSLGIAKVIQFKAKTSILDVGTGGGFPGIPLAIMFPETHFYLTDSVGKKITIVKDICKKLNLVNVSCYHSRVEDLDIQVDFVVGRAITKLPVFINWIEDKIKEGGSNSLKNGILYLKGGDLENELKKLKNKIRISDLRNYFEEDFFTTKRLVYIAKR